MNFSRAGITSIFVIILSTLFLTNCAYYTQVRSRKDLVDGAEAYKARKFAVAEQFFRSAISRDPNLATKEGQTAQVFLARTLHSEYIADRKQAEKAQQAIEEYQKVLQKNPDDQSSFKAVANLYENLQMQDQWQKWVTDRSVAENVPPEQRAEALVTLGSRKYTCANEISDTDATKKTVREGDKDVYKFVKPASPEDFEKLKTCTQEGLDLVNKAVELSPNSDSAWSYRANLLGQKARIAEMEGNKAEEDQYKAQATEAKDKFTVLNDERKRREAEEEARKQAEKEAANKQQ